MKIWMLTGDKVETAKYISIFAGIKGQCRTLFTVKYEVFNQETLGEKVDRLLSLFHENDIRMSIEPQ